MHFEIVVGIPQIKSLNARLRTGMFRKGTKGTVSTEHSLDIVVLQHYLTYFTQKLP